MVSPDPIRQRPDTWAMPRYIEGVPNLHCLVPNWLYRSAQPTGDGITNLQSQLGINTIINLRALHPDPEAPPGIVNVNREMNAWHIETEDVVTVLKAVTGQFRAPYLIHCLHGADRTGVMCAMYRVVVEGWSREEALDELRNGGFGYHSMFKNIPEYLLTVDVEEIKRMVKR